MYCQFDRHIFAFYDDFVSIATRPFTVIGTLGVADSVLIVEVSYNGIDAYI